MDVLIGGFEDRQDRFPKPLRFLTKLMRDAPTTRYALLASLQSDPKDSLWNEFVSLYEPAIYRFVRKLGPQDADTREIVQEVLLNVRQSALGKELPPDHFRRWLARIARNRTIDLLRKQKRYSNLLRNAAAEIPPNAHFTMEQLWEEEVRHHLFHKAAEVIKTQVSAQHWEAFWQTAIELQPVDQVAARLGMSAGNVYVCKCRVMKQLKQLVAESSFDMKGDIEE